MLLAELRSGGSACRAGYPWLRAEIPVATSYSRPHDMAGVANVQGVFMIFGDSITQGSFEPEHRGFGLRLARMYLIKHITITAICHDRCVCSKVRRPEQRALGV